MAQYRKRPLTVEACRFPVLGASMTAFVDWCNQVGFHSWEWQATGGIGLPTLEGTMLASPGDWIIKGLKGEFYPCRSDIFDITYEPEGPHHD